MKKVLYAGIALVVVIALILFIGISNLGPIIKSAVNTYGPEITGTAVNIEDVSVSIFSGKAKLKNFLLGNPQGFTSDKAMEVGAITVNIDEKSLSGNTIIIDKIEIRSPSVIYEKKGSTDNFSEILKNIEKRTSSSGKKKSKKPEAKRKKTENKGSETKILIRDFTLKNGRVSLVLPLLKGKSINAELHDIHLTNIGSGGTGVTAQEAIKIIMNAIYKNIKAPDVTKIFKSNMKNLGITLKALGSEKQKKIAKVTNKLKALFGKKKKK